LRTLLVVAYTGLMLYTSQQATKFYGSDTARSALHGIWNVEEFTLAGRELPLKADDPERWRRVILDYPGMIAVQALNDSGVRYLLKQDMEKKTLELSSRDNPTWKSMLSYQQPDADVLVLDGSFNGQPLHVKLRHTEPRSFLLTSRGFHWINEYPFNK